MQTIRNKRVVSGCSSLRNVAYIRSLVSCSSCKGSAVLCGIPACQELSLSHGIYLSKFIRTSKNRILNKQTFDEHKFEYKREFGDVYLKYDDPRNLLIEKTSNLRSLRSFGFV